MRPAPPEVAYSRRETLMFASYTPLMSPNSRSVSEPLSEKSVPSTTFRSSSSTHQSITTLALSPEPS